MAVPHRPVTLGAVILAGVAAAGCGDPTGDAQQRSFLTLPPDALALHWFDDGSLLVATGGGLVVYDPVADRPIRDLPAPAPDLPFRGAPCVSDTGGLVEFSHRGTGTRRAAGTSYAYADWRDTAPPTARRRAEWWATNPLDCTELRERDATTLDIDGRSIGRDGWIPQLVHSTRGDTDVYRVEYRLPDRRGDRGLTRLLAVARGPDGEILGPGVQFDLPYYHGALMPAHDRRNDRYLWVAASQRGFDARPEDWRLHAWLIRPDLSLDRAFTLPAGPWVYREGLLKSLSCFSCGCSCYEHLDVRFENNTVWLMVHGNAVKERHQGLYRVDLADTAAGPGETHAAAWTPVAVGSVDPASFAVAPDGCRAAFHQGGRLTVVDTCVGR